METSLVPLADSERDTENSEVSQEVLSVCPVSQTCSDELIAMSDSDEEINKHEILISPAMAYLAFYILFWEN